MYPNPTPTPPPHRVGSAQRPGPHPIGWVPLEVVPSQRAGAFFQRPCLLCYLGILQRPHAFPSPRAPCPAAFLPGAHSPPDRTPSREQLPELGHLPGHPPLGTRTPACHHSTKTHLSSSSFPSPLLGDPATSCPYLSSHGGFSQQRGFQVHSWEQCCL